MIAIALSCNPRLLIADEATTALDVTIQAQILELMKELTSESGTALIIITHNLGVVARYADRVDVMYAGRMRERGPADDLYASPLHPYTVGLFRSRPRLEDRGPLAAIPGVVPSPLAIPSGCPFHPRCPLSDGVQCVHERPPLEPKQIGHAAACWYSDRVADMLARREAIYTS